MQKIVRLLAFMGLSIIMADDLLGQTVIRDSVTISPRNVESKVNKIRTLNDCVTGAEGEVILFPIDPGTVTISTLANEYSPPGVTLGPLYISNSRFIGEGDTITVFSGISVGRTWTREFPLGHLATIWLVLGPEGTPDSGPHNDFRVVGTYPIDFDFFMCGLPEDSDESAKFANFNFKHVPFPVDHFAIFPSNTAISPGEFTHFWTQKVERGWCGSKGSLTILL
jgi:hypothetical protein